MIFELTGTPLRVMGTLHLLPSGRPLPAWVRTAYDWSEAVFVEHSPVEFMRLARQVEPLRQKSVSPAFKALLSKASGQALVLDGMRPGAAVVMALASRIIGNSGADQALHGWCQAEAKTFGYIEQPAQVLDMLDGVPEAEWTAGIQAELARPDSPTQQLQFFYDAWRKGRLADIGKVCNGGLFASALIRQKMLADRNTAWAANYREPALRSLVAVGAAHLVGPGNFLEALTRVSGRSVRRIV